MLANSLPVIVALAVGIAFSVILVFDVANFHASSQAIDELNMLQIVEIRTFGFSNTTIEDYRPNQVPLTVLTPGDGFVVNALVKNQNYAPEHFDLITQILDSKGIVIFIDIRPSVAVPLDHELWIDSKRPITIKETGKYVAKVFTWRGVEGSPEPLANGSELEIKVTTSTCEGKAECIIGNVTNVVDGDTLDINNTRIRLAIINTPEIGEPGYLEAKQFTSSVCPVGSKAIADEDDGQPEGSYNRVIAKVTCGDKVLNEELLRANLAEVLVKFCGVSEFRDEVWAKSNGC